MKGQDSFAYSPLQLAGARGCTRRLRWRWARTIDEQAQADRTGGEGQADLPLRHLRRRGAVDRHAAHARGHQRRGRPRRPRSRSASRSTPRHCRRRSSRASRTAASTCSSPATTVALLKLDAVVGLKGTVETVGGDDALTRVGITCALCHSTVDNSFAPGIGKRLDGWPNRDLNPGAIIALSPALDAAAQGGYNSWGAGKYDPRFNIDGLSKPVVIPPAYGLEGVQPHHLHRRRHDIAYWNRYVAVTQMGGLGTFIEPRLT